MYGRQPTNCSSFAILRRGDAGTGFPNDAKLCQAVEALAGGLRILDFVCIVVAPMENTMNVLRDIQRATIAARERTGDKTIGTQLRSGQLQVVRVTYPKSKSGGSVVVPVTVFLPIDEAIRAIKAL